MLIGAFIISYLFFYHNRSIICGIYRKPRIQCPHTSHQASQGRSNMIKRKHDMRHKPRPEHRGWARVTWCGENPVFQYHISPVIIDSLLPNPLKIVLMGALRNELRINLRFPLVAHNCRLELRDSPEQPLQFTSLNILLQQLLPPVNAQLRYNFVLLGDRLCPCSQHALFLAVSSM